jgi:hypothetical protein
VERISLGLASVIALASACAPPPPAPVVAPPTTASPAPTGTATIRADAARLRPVVRSPLARRFVDAAPGLPAVAPRFFLDGKLALEDFYYGTLYGSPLAYARALEVASAGDTMPRRVFDFGYGEIGHLRLLALVGADVTGVDVDPMLAALYSAPGDQGAFGTGRVTLVSGGWPGDAAVAAAVGEGFDLVVSKNVLKNGYIHPAEPVTEKRMIRLGVDDDAFVRALFRVTAPRGRVLVYNLCPAPAPPGQPYIPWADGRSPFTKAQWEAAGFHVVELDRDDSPAARAMGRALGWDADDDLEENLFALYTLVEK